MVELSRPQVLGLLGALILGAAVVGGVSTVIEKIRSKVKVPPGVTCGVDGRTDGSDYVERRFSHSRDSRNSPPAFPLKTGERPLNYLSSGGGLAMKWLSNLLNVHPLVSGMLAVAVFVVAYRYPPPLNDLWVATVGLSPSNLLIALLAIAFFARDTVSALLQLIKRDVAAATTAAGIAALSLWAAAYVCWGAMQLGVYLPFFIVLGLGMVAGLLLLCGLMTEFALTGHLPKGASRAAEVPVSPARGAAPIPEPAPDFVLNFARIPRSQQIYLY